MPRNILWGQGMSSWIIIFMLVFWTLIILTWYVLLGGSRCSLSLPIFPLAAFVVEKLVQKNCISEPVSVSTSVCSYCSSKASSFCFTWNFNWQELAIWILFMFGFSPWRSVLILPRAHNNTFCYWSCKNLTANFYTAGSYFASCNH